MNRFRKGNVEQGGSIIVAFVGLMLLLLAIVVLLLTRERWEYDYIDMNGNKGVAHHCETPRMGLMQCDVPGQGKVQVKNYRGRKVD